MKFVIFSVSQALDISYEQVASNDPFLKDFTSLFLKIEKKENEIIFGPQQNLPEFRQAVDLFIEKYKSLDKKIYKLRTYFTRINEGEYFITLPTEYLNINEVKKEVSYFLTALNSGDDYLSVSQRMEDLYGELQQLYNVYPFNERTKKHIGEPEKSKRVCRFCGLNSNNVTFTKKAHAISEALGNKNIITNEECDECNARFGRADGIEASLISYFQFFNVFFDVKTKNGVPKIKGKNFEISSDSEASRQINIKYSSIIDAGFIKNIDKGTANIRLDTNYSIVEQDIYRSLCKFALSVISNDCLEHFGDTIKWINRETTLSKLPKVAFLFTYSSFSKHPRIVLYLRKNNDHSLPHLVGQFNHTFITIVFIVPLSNNDSIDFTEKEDQENFWRVFNRLNQFEGWQFHDFSNSLRRKLSVNMKFNKSQDT